MNIRDLEYAVAVAAEEHFGNAAESCNVSQPALSAQIRKLEDELGVALFERTNRSVKITPAGLDIVARAKEVLAEVDGIRAVASAHADPLAGTLRLGMIPTIGPYLTPILLPSVRYGLPHATLTLYEHQTQILEANLLAGDIDAAILATPVEDAHLSQIPLYWEPFWIALPLTHPLAAEEEIDLSDIEQETLLLLEDGHCLRDQALSFSHTTSGRGGRNSQVSTQQTSLTTILSLVGGGAGITLAPAMSLSGSWLTDSGIAMRHESSGKAGRMVSLTYRTAFPRRELLEKLADIICAAAPDTVMPERR